MFASLVISAITRLAVFNAALGEGAGIGSREYSFKRNAPWFVYPAKSDFLVNASRLSRLY